MNILIIGSKGFIGSHCVSHFSEAHTVYTCDVMVDYDAKNYFLIDATNASYDEVFKANTYDVCINCSGAANVSESVKNPQRDFSLNVDNVFKQLDALRKYNSNCKYINLSSAAVYGNPSSLPIHETHQLQPISPYGTHKKMAELICQEFFENYNINTCSLRIFSAYGPGLKKQLFWDLYKKSLNKTAIKLYGTGFESRDFIYVTDVVNAIEIAITHAPFKSDVFNLAAGNEVAIKDAVALFYNTLDGTHDFYFGGEQRAGDPINWVADIKQLTTLGFKAEIKLTEGLKKYVSWLKN
jgi:dTDP-glucose 4,6-dehydratase/UDP-glucose 4-epimerase